MNKLHKRHTPRAKWHNYNGAIYFVTICTDGRIHHFGSVRNNQTHLTEIGEYTKLCIEKIGEINKDIEIPLYVIMPNHIHMIVVIDANKTDANIENVRLSYYGSRDDTKRLPQCDSPTAHTEINNETDAYNTNVGLSYYGSRDDTKRLPQCDSPTAHTEINHDINTEMQRRAYCCGRLSHIIGRFKSAVTRFANQNNLPFKWQSRFHDHIIRNNTDMNNIANYIVNNPANWELDCYFMNEQ